MAKSEDLQGAVKAFLEIGNERNGLVHGDYATFALEKTLEDVYVLYKRALPFVQFLPIALRDCEEKIRS